MKFLVTPFLVFSFYLHADPLVQCNDSKGFAKVTINKLVADDASGNQLEFVVERNNKSPVVVRGNARSVGSNLIYKSHIDQGFDGPVQDDGVYESFRMEFRNASAIEPNKDVRAKLEFRNYEYEKKYFCDKVDRPAVPRDENDPIVKKHKCTRWDMVRQPLKIFEANFQCRFSGESEYKNFCAEHDEHQLIQLLFAAAKGKDVDLVEQSLACDADINESDDTGCTPLMMAVANDTVACSASEPVNDAYKYAKSRFLFNLISSNGAELDRQDALGESAVHKAVRNENVGVLKDMILMEANLNLQDADGSTPLMLAADKASTKMISVLVEGGADLGLKDSQGRTAYDRGSKLSPEKRELLLEPKVVLTVEGQTNGECLPLEFRIPKGEFVRLVMKASNENMFMLSVPNANISLMAEKGKSASRTFKVSESGTLAFTCGYHGGKQSDGKIIVE